MADLRVKTCTRCGRLKPVGNGGAMCLECAEKERRKRNETRRRDWAQEYSTRKENSVYRAFYNSKEWKMLSRRYSQEKGYKCEECSNWGTDVHHVVPIQTDEGWNRRFDKTNLKLLCVKCHNKAHGRDFSNGWRGDGRKAEETALAPKGAPDESGDRGEAGNRRALKVSDYRR